MATQELGIKLSLDGTSGIVGGLSQVAGKLGDLENASDKVSGAFKSLGAAAIAALGVGSVAALSSMVKGYIDAAEALKDLSIKTGASVENLSAFASIGKLTGTTADTIGQAMNRLAKTMAGSSEESKGAAQALKALGIDFAAFDAMRPDDKMVTLAKAMNQFEDGSAKSAVAMTLMGKSGAELLPFMRDLGNTGELVAKVTADQAEMADQYNDALTISAAKTEDMKRALALGLLPTLISLHDLTQLLGGAIKDYLAGGASKASGEFDLMKGVIRTLGTVMEALIVLASDVAFVFKGIGTEIGGIAAQAVAFLTGDFKAVGEIRQQMLSDSQKAREELDRFQASVLGSTDKILAQRDAVQNHSLSAAENRNEMERLGKAHGATGTKVLEYKAATESTKVVVDQAAKAGQDYINSLDLQFAALNAQISAGRELTKAEQELLKLEEDLRSGKKKLTDDELAAVKAKLETIDALKEEIRQREELLKTQGKVAELSTKLQDAQSKETDALRKGNIELQAQIDALVLAPKELAAREAATLRSRAADLEWQAAMEGGNYQLEEQARLLRERAGLVETNVMVKEAKDAAAEWKKTTDAITQDLTDALMRGFENGKGFVENLVDYIKNKFKTMVAEYIVKPLMEPLGQAIAGFMAPVRDAISGMVSGLSSQIGKLITDLTGISLRSAGTSAAGSAAGSATAGAGAAAAGSAAAGTAAAGTAAGTAAATGSAAVGTAAATTGATAAGITTAGSVAGEAAIALGVDTALSTAAGTTAAAASGSAAAGSSAAASIGLESVAAAVPWALAAIAAYQILFGGDTSGTPHMGGSVQADANGATPTDGSGIGFKVDRDDRVVGQLSALGTNLATSLNNQRAAAGLPRDVAVELGYADDSSKDGAWGQFKLMVGGQTLAFWGSRNKWPGQALANGAEGWAQFIGLIDETVKSVFSAGMAGKPSGIALPEDFLAASADMPAGWNGWSAKDKIGWLNGHNVSADALRSMGISDEDIAWMMANGYTGSSGSSGGSAGDNGYALGGVFTNSLVTRPTAFPMGLMGEAGPEAIMPLARSSDGSLGVRAQADGLGGAAVSTLERLISRVSQLEAALVGALERNARIVSDSIVLEGGRA